MWDDCGYTEDAVACAVHSAPNPNGCAPTLVSAEDSGLYSTAPTTLLPSIKSHDLTCVWPVFGASNQSSARRILEHIIPLGSIALVASQQMIVKARLPEGR